MDLLFGSFLHLQPPSIHRCQAAGGGGVFQSIWSHKFLCPSIISPSVTVSFISYSTRPCLRHDLYTKLLTSGQWPEAVDLPVKLFRAPSIDFKLSFCVSSVPSSSSPMNLVFRSSIYIAHIPHGGWWRGVEDQKEQRTTNGCLWKEEDGRLKTYLLSIKSNVITWTTIGHDDGYKFALVSCSGLSLEEGRKLPK